MGIQHYQSNELSELDLYDQTRFELRKKLVDHFPANFELEDTITAYAYWICTAVIQRGKDWLTALREYVDDAIRDARLENQAERIEINILNNELRQATDPLLDVGSGWGRLARIYQASNLLAYYVEPSNLGCQLLRRNNLSRSIRCLGQYLCFPDNFFRSVVIGWVLHHDAPDVPALDVLKEIERVICDGGRIYSIEPLSADFDEQKWCTLVQGVGFLIEKVDIYFEMPVSERIERYAFLTARK